MKVKTLDMYATKRRRRNVKSSVKATAKDPPSKSNPSKRHRERLNAELDHLASLLPFEQSVISKLDKLSILRLAVSYLRTKSYFQAAIHERYSQENRLLQRLHHRIHHSHHLYSELGLTDSESVLQALNGFLFVVTCDGEVFFASHTVEQYLGFHQSDIIHQSVLELIHSEDREQFKLQLNWRSSLPPDLTESSLDHVLLPENGHVLQRCFTVRFRCLLDNTSGFITLEISGKIRVLHGQSLKGEEAPLALFALCCPFGPLPLQDVSNRDYTFKSKHKMDMSPVSMDPRGKLFFGYSDRELMTKGGYDLVHTDDLSYYAAAHQELIKTGSSGLIAYRLLTKDFRWVWLQTSSKVIYKNSKPDFVICTHRHLTEDEGRDLARKRGSEFKLPYAIVDNDPSSFCSLTSDNDDLSKVRSSRNKKSKNQLRDYLHTGRKRKAPYRELYHNLGAYIPYPNVNGYGECGTTGESKSDGFMYSYAGQNLAFDAEQYRFGYHAFGSGTIYPPLSGSSTDTDKYGYANGYYIDTRQYPYSFQCHPNNYSDIVAHATSKYKENIAKYGYGNGYYGLDLSGKLGQYESDAQQCSDANFQKYSGDYAAGDKLSLMGGMFDPLYSGCFYAPNSLSNGNRLLSCAMTMGNSSDNLLSCNLFPNSGSLCSGYQTGYPTVVDRYIQTTAGDRESEKSASNGSSSSQSEEMLNAAAAPNGHCTVIRRNGATKSMTDKEKSNTSHPLSNGDEAAVSATPRVSWPSCIKSSSGNAEFVANNPSAAGQMNCSFSHPSDVTGQDKVVAVVHNEASSSVTQGMATSVIRMPRCNVPPSNSGHTGTSASSTNGQISDTQFLFKNC